MEASIQASDRNLLSRNQQLQQELDAERQLKYECEKELAELKNRPPPVTPRQQQQQQQQQLHQQSRTTASRTPSPTKGRDNYEHHHHQQQQQQPPKQPTPVDLIYLPEYCERTLRAVQANAEHLGKYKQYAEKLLEQELDELGIEPDERRLAPNDFKLKMNALKASRPTRTDNLAMFNELRLFFADLCDKHTSSSSTAAAAATSTATATTGGGLKLSTSLKSLPGAATSTNVTSRVKFESLKRSTSMGVVAATAPASAAATVPTVARTQAVRKPPVVEQESEETNDDVSLSNALESNDEDDTEPTKSFVDNNNNNNNNNTSSKLKGHNDSHNTSVSNVSRSSKREAYVEDISDLESARSLKKHSMVDETKRKIESQLEVLAKRGGATGPGGRPAPGAQPIGFVATPQQQQQQQSGPAPVAARKAANQQDEDSFSSITDVDLDNNNEHKHSRPKR